MSDKSQRTEQATPHRLEKARREGQFSSSKELLSAAQFLAFTYLLSRWGAGWFERTGEETRRLLVHAFHAEMSFQQLAGLCRHTLVSSLTPLAVLGAALVALSLASQMAMTRMGFSFQRLAPDLKRLNPVSRLREMLRQNVWATAKALVLLPLAAWAVWTIARDNLADYAAFPLTDTRAGVSRLAGSLMSLMWKAAGLFLVLGVADLARERRRYKQEYLRFLDFAYASLLETIDHLETLHETGSLTDDELFSSLEDRLTQLSKALFSFIRGVEDHHDPDRA